MKLKTLAVAAAILVAAGVFYEHVAVGSPVSALRAFYQEYNETYFGNELPKNPIITITTLTDEMGRSWMDSQGNWHIAIDKQSNPITKQAEMTMVHEMCHVYLKGEMELVVGGNIDDHGPRFQNCMLNAAKAGAFKDLW